MHQKQSLQDFLKGMKDTKQIQKMMQIHKQFSLASYHY